MTQGFNNLASVQDFTDNVLRAEEQEHVSTYLILCISCHPYCRHQACSCLNGVPRRVSRYRALNMTAQWSGRRVYVGTATPRLTYEGSQREQKDWTPLLVWVSSKKENMWEKPKPVTYKYGRGCYETQGPGPYGPALWGFLPARQPACCLWNALDIFTFSDIPCALLPCKADAEHGGS